MTLIAVKVICRRACVCARIDTRRVLTQMIVRGVCVQEIGIVSLLVVAEISKRTFTYQRIFDMNSGCINIRMPSRKISIKNAVGQIYVITTHATTVSTTCYIVHESAIKSTKVPRLTEYCTITTVACVFVE